MKYILARDVALRSFRKIPFCYVRKGYDVPVAVDLDTFCHLCRCDGATEQDADGILDRLEKDGVIRSCAGEEASPAPWQRYRECDNPAVPNMALVITEKCNFNCLHCFNASENNSDTPELSMKQIESILDEAEKCGIQAIKLTGGEPMLHPDFFRIAESIDRRGMWIYELVTNGSMITQAALDALKRLSTPLGRIRISFDGTGYHEYMRGIRGVEEKTLQAIRLCVKNGFSVGVNVNFNRINEAAILPTLLMLDGMGADEIWVLRTTEAPRWAKKNGGASFGWSEYYERSLRIAADYMEKAVRAPVFFWNFLTVYPARRAFAAYNVYYDRRTFSPDRPTCKAVRATVVVGANGILYPCVSMMGFFRELNIELADITARPLQSILNDSPYADLCHSCIRDNIAQNKRCRDCPFLVYCGGGCISAALLSGGRYFGPSDSSCLFFRDRWHKKIREALPGCTDLAPMDDDMDASCFDGAELSEFPTHEADARAPFSIVGEDRKKDGQ